MIGEDGERQCPTCSCNPCSAGAVGGALGGILFLSLIVNIVITINCLAKVIFKKNKNNKTEPVNSGEGNMEQKSTIQDHTTNTSQEIISIESTEGSDHQKEQGTKESETETTSNLQDT